MLFPLVQSTFVSFTTSSVPCAATYELKTEQGVIGRMQLFKSVYRLGEEIIGTLDLSKASVPCLQVNVYTPNTHTRTYMCTHTCEHSKYTI